MPLHNRIINTVKEGMLAPRRSISRLYSLPNFLIIGAMKSGTTSMYRNLVQHPSIVAALWKEIYFFDSRYYKGLGWYRSHFQMRFRQKTRGNFPVTGEASPSYLYHPHAARRVHESIPDVRLIVLLRNPVQRAYSHYHHEVTRRTEMRSFEEAIEQEEELLSGELDKIMMDEHYYSRDYMKRSYLNRGIYVDQLKIWMNYFDRDRFLILQSESFFRDPPLGLKRVSNFLDLPDWQPSAVKKHGASKYPKMDAATRERLIAFFEPHNQRLYEFLGIDFGWK